MPLPDEFLQELVFRNPITDVVSSYVRVSRGEDSGRPVPVSRRKDPVIHRVS